MKLKEINRTAIPAWSPAQQHPIYLAAGTSAQQLDATFSTNALLEIFELDLVEPALAMKSCGAFSSPHRYHKLVWGPHGVNDQGLLSGVLIAGGETGNIILYDPAKIIAGDSEVVITESDKHTGPVRALDVNSFQTNLVVSGGNESEIYIWDLNSFSTPMTPGPKSQPLEDISCVAWNCQVQHILASASPSGRASIWDLRKNDLIIKVSDHSNRMHCSGLAWNPEVATQLVLASEDDRMPVIQMWDLRFATSPLKVLENHTRGVLAIAWSLADPELLLSCGKDNRILCWNPNTAEVLYELPSSQWCFDIQWCPRNPALLSAASFDGRISICSIMGGNNDAVNSAQADQVSSSFANMDPFGTGQTLPPLQLPQTSSANSTVIPLKKPPKWIRRPVGASFAFGGKLVSLENIKPTPQQPQQPLAHVVHVSQVVTDTDFLDRSNQLQATLTAGSFVEFCQRKIEVAQNEFEKTIWAFLKVHFEDDARGKYLELLGYKKEELALKIASALERKDLKSDEGNEQPETGLTPTDELDVAPQTDFTLPVNGQPESELDLNITPLVEGESKDVVQTANTSKEEPTLPEEVEENGDIIAEDAPAAEESPELAEIPVAEEKPVLQIPSNIKVNQDVDRLITQALIIGDFEAAVSLCLHDDRMADAIILAIAGGPELLEKTQKKYLTKTQSKIGKLISAVVMRDWLNILETCDLQNWKEALAAVITYAKPEEFSSLCGLLGSRLEAAEDSALQAEACLCYICAGSVEQLVSCWSKAQDSSSPLLLQDLVEKVVILRQAVEKTQSGVAPAVGTLLAEKMSQYAGLLASQGSLQTAISYLPTNTDQVAVQQLRERLSRALGQHGSAPVHNRHPVSRAAVPQQTYTPVQPQTQSLPPQPTQAAPTQQYYQQVRAASTVTSWSNQTPTVLPSAPRPLAPAKDLQSEPKPAAFPLQAPVSASPAASNAFMYSQQYQTYPQVQQFTPSAGGPAIYQPLQYSSSTSAPLPPPPSSSAAPPFYPSQFMPPASSQAAPPTFPRHPFSASQQAPSAPPLSSPSTASFSPPPFSSGASFQHGGPGSPTAFLPPPPTGASGTQAEPDMIPASQRTGGITQDATWFYEGPQNGWNDPPALIRGSKKKKVPENYTPPAPITAPIMAPLGEPQPVATMQPSLQPQQLPPQPAGVPAPFNPIQQQPQAPTLRNPAMPSMPLEGPPGAPTGDIIQPMQSLPTEKITKKPIPDEHLILKTTFEGLIQKCLAAATDPQTKRKLDDANKRLESLYDKLREQTLSPAIVGGLHNMARSIESRAYTDSLNIHTHIVSNSNFSETSAFMPVLKVVLTQANKLGV
ncbi:protein transport protein Sec31A isoform X1 [Ictalurus furcatus]|uniref:protein transport protein Sec31A isoform X1 n=1 Tax=Ictalurus furcatus TaxID=66913 RepID=UPI00235083E9|nr:protein transport protein Sec31A isoform X1 [Ictalurus furcatus]XP_053501082.1 protein transport protein Sec31A isoform X1 [Ictalurus furcatus]XP_053501083.1 protein transport protein Sec31A isoform X1 [Ictalurus furcatus]